MHLAPDQPITGPVLPVSPPDNPLETTKRTGSVTSLVPESELVEDAKEAAEEAATAVFKPFWVLMAERTYPWIARDSLYGLQHRLQNFDICLPRPLEKSPVGRTVWVFFLHGGAWRDEAQDKAEIHPALNQLLNSSTPDSTHALSHIAGIVSLNYGLSTYASDPDHNHDPSLTQVHPRHISDLVVALGYFQEKYQVGARDADGNPLGHDYVIMGHSAGATLAFQSWVQRCPCATYRPARAIVGLAGIYNLPAVVSNHVEEPFYRKFITDAFTSDEKVWVEASPSTQQFDEMWEANGAETIILGASEGDVLVEKEQFEEMQALLECQGWELVREDGDVGRDCVEGKSVGRKKEVLMLELEGSHDEIWKLGTGLRRSIELVIRRLFPLEENDLR